MNHRTSRLIWLFAFLLAPVSVSGQYGDSQTEPQPKFNWPEGKKAAISLTFDDGRSSQVLNGVPIFNRYGVKATFFVNPRATVEHLDLWKAAAAQGHEIGNHSLTHPCSGNFPWSRDNALEEKSLSDMERDIDVAGKEIEELLGVVPTTFAYPCGQKFVGRGEALESYVPLIAKKFRAARGWLDEHSNDPAFCDMAQLMGVELDGLSFEEAKALIDDAAKQGYWIVFAAHDIGKAAPQTALESTLDAICAYATRPDSGLWIDTVHNIADWVGKHRGEQSRR